MTVAAISDKKLKKAGRINEWMKNYFIAHLDIISVAANQLMFHFVQEGIFTSEAENALALRSFLGELHKKKQLELLPDISLQYHRRKCFFTRAIK